MAQHNLNDPYKNAFRPITSTETVLNMLTDYILKPLDDGIIAQLLLLDLSSELYNFPWDSFYSFKDVGTTGNTYDVIKIYITKRSYSVLIEKEISLFACSTHGVP